MMTAKIHTNAKQRCEIQKYIARRPVSMNFSDKNTPLIGQFPHKIGILSSSKQLSDKKFCVRFPSNCRLKTATLRHNAAMKIT